MNIQDGTAEFQTRDKRLTEQAKAMIDLLYPVGIIVSTTSVTAPFSVGTWEEIGKGRVLQGCGTGQTAGNTVEAGLPNITGSVYSCVMGGADQNSGALIQSWIEPKNAPGGNLGNNWASISMDASRSNSIYGGSERRI